MKTNLILSSAQLEVLNNAAQQLVQQKETEGKLKGMVAYAKYAAKPKGFAKGFFTTMFNIGEDQSMEELMAIVAQMSEQPKQ